LVPEDTVACDTLLRELFERPDEIFGQPVLPLSPGLATLATVDKESYLPREVALSFACETHPISEEVPLSQRAGEVEVPLLRRSGSVTSTVPDEVAGHTSEALSARPKTPLREAVLVVRRKMSNPKLSELFRIPQCRLSRKAVTL